MASNQPGKCCTVGVRHEGEPTGKDITIADNITAYLATPSESEDKKIGILYLPDIYGIYNNSKLMVDQFAANGYTCLLPDIFNGDQLSFPMPENFDIMRFINNGSNGKNPHTTKEIDEITIKGIKALKDLGVNKIGAVGYCFGAKYVVRNYKSGIDVGYVAHPSFVQEDELAAITGPLSIAAAQNDSIFPVENRHKSEEILVKTGLPFQINLYSGVSHGFAVRGDPKDKSVKFAKEQAFYQAIAWFDEHLA